MPSALLAHCAQTQLFLAVTAHGADPVFGGWNKVPSLEGPSTLPGSKKGERQKGGKKGRRRKGGKPSLKALRAVDMAAYLAKGALRVLPELTWCVACAAQADVVSKLTLRVLPKLTWCPS